MPITRPSPEEILNSMYTRLQRELPISRQTDSTLIGVLVKIFASEIDTIWSYIDDLERQANLSTASGTALDSWGLFLGVTRKQASTASTEGFSRSVVFSNSGGGSLTVPSGTRVYNSINPGISYFTNESATIAPGNGQEVHVTAANIGEYFNVGIGQLNLHSFPSAALSVTNVVPIQTGGSLESDGSFRERILQEFTRRDSLTLENLNALLRSVPGVRDIFILNKKRGPGTFDAIVLPYIQTDINSILNQVSAILEEAVPAGISWKVKPPQYKQLDIKVSLSFNTVNSDQPEVVRNSIISQITSRIDNLDVENGSGNGTLYLGQLVATPINSSTSVTNAVFTFGLDGSSLSPTGQINLSIGERIVLRSLSVN